jgi:hypothetical protein
MAARLIVIIQPYDLNVTTPLQASEITVCMAVGKTEDANTKWMLEQDLVLR